MHLTLEERQASDPDSAIHAENVAETCGQCHADVRDKYRESIHGRALAAGISDSPTCTDCHGEHLILSPGQPEARTSAANSSIETCGNCHRDSTLIDKYGLKEEVVETYRDSYHGWATRFRSREAANCVSCHTAHEVLPARDPASTVHPDRVADTCGQCHPGADARFARSYTHETASRANPASRWIRSFYLLLIPLTIGAMLAHNALIWAYHVMEKRRREGRARQVLRLDRIQLMQHAALAAFFIILVITGFALRFPEAAWVRILEAGGMDEWWRSTIHRTSGVVLILLGLSHLFYVRLSPRGRLEFRAMLPAWQDLIDLRTALRFYARRSRIEPRFGSPLVRRGAGRIGERRSLG